MKLRIRVITLVAMLLLIFNLSFAKGQVFGIVAKSSDDSNFIDAWKGSEKEAVLTNDTSELLGPKGAAHPRAQAKIVEDAIKSKKYSALAISVTSSEFLSKIVVNSDIPILTFDSDFRESNKKSRISYIGIDNETFGRDLAKIAKKLYPNGGTVCIMTTFLDTNLEKRVDGVRKELSGDNFFRSGDNLKGEGGWTEVSRSPMNAKDSLERTMELIDFTLAKLKPDVFISVGSWPISGVDEYRAMLDKYGNRKTAFVIGVGKITPELYSLMNNKLVHGYVSIDFPKMGETTLKLMRDAANGKKIPEEVFLENKIEFIKK